MSQAASIPWAPVASIADVPPSPPVDQVGADERAARLRTRSIKKESKREALHLVLSMIDLTTLEGADSEGKVKRLCAKAKNLHSALPGLPHVGAVCVYPNWVKTAVAQLEGTGIGIASVASGFPSGQIPLELRIEETSRAAADGATEIDMVISRGRFLAGDHDYVFEEVQALKEACGDAHLKVILETGELETYDNVRRASDVAMYAGADFIKTSTGKVKPAATLPVTLVMLEAIRDFWYATGRRVGMKPAGGISNSKLAIKYLVMLQETLGRDWMNPELFRFGASSLANDVLMQIAKQETGHYQSPDYFSLA